MRNAVVGAILVLCSCTTARVAPEIETFAEAVADTGKAVTPLLRPSLRAEADQALTVAAERGDVWLLTDACRDMIRARPGALAETCGIERIRTDESPRPIGAATAATRRMGVLVDYVAALELLADAGTDREVTEAYGAALAGLENLGKAAPSEGLAGIVAALKGRRGQTDRVVSYAVGALRFNRMRSVVTRADPDVQEVVRDIQLSLFQLRADPEYHRLADALIAAEEAALVADPADPVAYRAALAGLEAAHAAFFAHYDSSIYVKVGRIAVAHAALARTLRRPGSAEEAIDYIKSLRALAAQIGG